MGENVANTGSGGGKHAGLWRVLQGCDTSQIDIRVVDIVTDGPYSPDTQGLPPQDDPSDDGATV